MIEKKLILSKREEIIRDLRETDIAGLYVAETMKGITGYVCEPQQYEKISFDANYGQLYKRITQTGED